MSTLNENVEQWLNQKVKEGYTKQQAIEKLLSEGFSSGIVEHLVYYYDAVKFFDKFMNEIMNLVQDSYANLGFTSEIAFINSLNPKNQYTMDELISKGEVKTHAKKELAWFAFETTVKNYQTRR